MQIPDASRAYAPKAELYARYRWDYAVQAVETLFEVCRLGAQACVADIGAGTGKLTRQIAGWAQRVIALEPGRDMRQIAARELRRIGNCQVVAGRAEALPLAERSLDLIAVAQALHWFESRSARAEFRRVLKAGGWLAVLYNRGTREDLNQALQSALNEPRGMRPSHAGGAGDPVAIHFYYEGQPLRWSFPFTLHETWEQFFGGQCSASNAPCPGEAGYEAFENALWGVFERFRAPHGRLEVRGLTELHLGQVGR